MRDSRGIGEPQGKTKGPPWTHPLHKLQESAGRGLGKNYERSVMAPLQQAGEKASKASRRVPSLSYFPVQK